MRVALDTSALYTTEAGNARYIRGLLRGLRALNPAGITFDEIAWPVSNFGYRQPARALRTLYREVVWARFVAPGQIRATGADLFHSTAAVLVTPPPGVRHVATLHDLAVLRHPERFRSWHRRAARLALRRLATVQRVICISRFSADEAMDLLGLPASRIEVVHNGSDFHPDDGPVAATPPDAPVPEAFFLFVGNLEPGKNLGLLWEAYRLAGQRRVSVPPLLIVGARWTGVAGEGPPPDGWQYLGRQPDAALVHLYQHARALLFPSKYEGFGLPIAEAMALGCPVICSPVASLPEVAGDAALLVPQTPDAYLDAMLQLGHDDRARGELAERGRRQAARFTWRRCASDVLEVYRGVDPNFA